MQISKYLFELLSLKILMDNFFSLISQASNPVNLSAFFEIFLAAF